MKHININNGFTFIELLIVLAVFSILIGAIFSFFTSQRDTYRMEELRLERDQNLRMAMESITRELTVAGHRAAAPEFVSHLSRWVPSDYLPSVPMAVDMDANPKITLGEEDLPDTVTLACSISTTTNPTTLSKDADGTLLTVSLSNSESEKQYRAGDILSVGYLPEYAVVAAVDGNMVTIDTNPEDPGLQPLSNPHPAESPLDEVSIISYAVFNDENDLKCKRHEAGRPILKRKINAGGFYPVAENISKLKVVSPQEGVVAVSLTGRTEQDRLAIGEMTLTRWVSLRNDLDAGFATDCTKPDRPGGIVLTGGLDDSLPCRISLSWDPVTENASGDSLTDMGCPVTGYRIYYDGVPGVRGYYMDVDPGDATGYELNVSGISAAAFYISIAAENSGGMGRISAEASIEDTISPDKVEGVSGTISAMNEITLFWEENMACDLAGYYLYRKKDSGFYELASGLIPAGRCEYADSGLAVDACYRYRIEAVDFGFHPSEPSDVVTVLLP